MKKLYTLPLLILSFYSFAQERIYQTEPFKGADQIIIKTGKSDQDAFLLASNVLQDQGWAIESANKDILTINTKPKTGQSAAMLMFEGQVYLVAGIRQGDIILKGFLKTTTSASIAGKTYQEVPVASFKNPEKQAFGYVYKTAQAFKPLEIVYSGSVRK